MATSYPTWTRLSPAERLELLGEDGTTPTIELDDPFNLEDLADELRKRLTVAFPPNEVPDRVVEGLASLQEVAGHWQAAWHDTIEHAAAGWVARRIAERNRQARS